MDMASELYTFTLHYIYITLCWTPEATVLACTGKAAQRRNEYVDYAGGNGLCGNQSNFVRFFAGLDIGNYVCGNQADEPLVINIDKQVEDVAIAVAEAFAEVSTMCMANGNAEVRAEAYALAQDRATAIGTAVSEIFASAESCNECTAVISALSETSKEIVAEAVAEAWTEASLYPVPPEVLFASVAVHAPFHMGLTMPPVASPVVSPQLAISQ